MYSTCTFCHAALGKNEALEHFPVGSRVAIDQARGRLWAVCSACGQWNLSPIETRWEAIEEGERLYRDTRSRVSTDQIGLARLRDGTELIRIGEPLRPEFAAWRYGERFAKRWRLSGRLGVGVGLALHAFKFGGPWMSVVGGAPVVGVLSIATVVRLLERSLTANWVQIPGLGRVRLTYAHAKHTRILRQPDAPGGWALRLPYEPPTSGKRVARFGDPFVSLTGADAQRVVAVVMPRLNRFGGHKQDVTEAVRALEAHGGLDPLLRLATTFSRAVRDSDRAEVGVEQWEPDEPERVHIWPGEFARTPAHVRLAVEMALHEETERRALQGELTELEQRWKEAEEIAAVADRLVESPGVMRALERLRLR